MKKELRNIFKKITKRFLCQTGGFLTVLGIIGLVSLAVGLHAFKGEAKEYLENKEDVTKYDINDSSGDANIGAEKSKSEFVEIVVKGFKTAAGSYDDTGLLTIAEQGGVFNTKEEQETEKTEEDESIKLELKSNGLPEDKLMVDAAKIIKKQLIKKATKNTSEEDIDVILYETLSDIQEGVEAIEELEGIDKDIAEDIDDLEVIIAIDKTLEDEGNLEDPEVIKLKNDLSKFESAKKYIQEKLDSYKYYEEKGYIISDTSGRTDMETELEDLNKKINETNSQIEKIQTENEQAQIEEEAQEADNTSNTATEEKTETVENKTIPTIELSILQGPTFSEADQVCYYRVTAKVTGYPEPEISFSRDDSNGAWGDDTVQINLKDNKSYTLTATAKNSEGEAKTTKVLSWGCEKILLGSVTLNGRGKLTGSLDTDYYNIKMTIDLDTGKITGNISFYGSDTSYITSTDPETGEETQIPITCGFGYNNSLKGTMNLDTRAINASSSGYVSTTSGGVCSGAASKYITITLNGTLNSASTSASGTDNSGDYWSVSR